MNDDEQPLELIGPLGGEERTESVYEHDPPRRVKAGVWAAVGLVVVLGLVVALVVVATPDESPDDTLAESDRQAETTSDDTPAQDNIDAESPDGTPAETDRREQSDERGARAAEDQRRASRRDRSNDTRTEISVLPTTLPPAQGLPRRRPEALLYALDVGLMERSDEPNSAVIFRKDLTDGREELISVSGQPTDLLYVDGNLIVREGRDVRLIDLETPNQVLLARDTSSVLAAFNPPRVVVTFDERSTTGFVRARVVGTDGLTVTEAIFPAEARVLGAIGEHIFVHMAGEIWAWTGSGEPTYLGAGRPIGIGASGVIAVRCSRDGCALEVVGIDDEPPFDITAGTRHEFPPRLSRARPEFWDTPGVVSPNGRMVAFHLAQIVGNVRGVMAIDLVTGAHAFSPEQSTDLGDIAWSSDSRYMLYALEGDVMVWEPDFTSAMGPSGRVHVNRQLVSLAVT